MAVDVFYSLDCKQVIACWTGDELTHSYFEHNQIQDGQDGGYDDCVEEIVQFVFAVDSEQSDDADAEQGITFFKQELEIGVSVERTVQQR